MKNTTLQPLKRKWSGPIDKIGKFHSAFMGQENGMYRTFFKQHAYAAIW